MLEDIVNKLNSKQLTGTTSQVQMRNKNESSTSPSIGITQL